MNCIGYVCTRALSQTGLNKNIYVQRYVLVRLAIIKNDGFFCSRYSTLVYLLYGHIFIIIIIVIHIIEMLVNM